MPPLLDLGPLRAVRDPALVFRDGECHVLHTVASPAGAAFALELHAASTSDLRTWSHRTLCGPSPLNFSSPGNVVTLADGSFALCLQSYPIPPGATWGSEDSRLWLMRSRDLLTWSEPQLLSAAGCTATWSRSPRQIDPYLVAHDGRWWCFYKTQGQLGVMVSDDLAQWREASPERPVLGSGATPDRATLENPCVVPVAGDPRGRFALFFSPCRNGRGIGLAWSDDLLAWRDVRYLDFPALPWADGGPTAAMVIDRRAATAGIGAGSWLMGFHGDRHDPANAHSAALGMAVSDDLERWRPLTAE